MQYRLNVDTLKSNSCAVSKNISCFPSFICFSSHICLQYCAPTDFFSQCIAYSQIFFKILSVSHPRFVCSTVPQRTSENTCGDGARKRWANISGTYLFVWVFKCSIGLVLLDHWLVGNDLMWNCVKIYHWLWHNRIARQLKIIWCEDVLKWSILLIHLEK